MMLQIFLVTTQAIVGLALFLGFTDVNWAGTGVSILAGRLTFVTFVTSPTLLVLTGASILAGGH